MGQVINLVPLGERTVSENFVGNADRRDASLESNPDVRVYLNVIDVAGTTPTLDVVINATINGVQYQIGAFTQRTTTGKEVIIIAGCPKDIQIQATLGGTTPNFDFEVNLTR